MGVQEFSKQSFVLLVFILASIFVITGLFALLSEVYPNSFNLDIWENIEKEIAFGI